MADFVRPDEGPRFAQGESVFDRLERFECRLAEVRSRAERPVVFPITNGDALWLVERLEAVASAVKSGTESPMMTGRDAIVEALDG